MLWQHERAFSCAAAFANEHDVTYLRFAANGTPSILSFISAASIG